jgi:hypothetical protein
VIARTDARQQLQQALDDWHQLLTGHVEQARGFLNLVLEDRIIVAPLPASHQFKLIVKVHFGRLLATVVPALGAQDLGSRMASPTGISDLYTRRVRLPRAA